MKEKLMNDNFMKVLSVFIAILIWLLVANTNDPVVSKRFTDIPVKVINDTELTDKGYAYEIIEGDMVTITVRGKNSIVSGLRDSDFKAVADFSKLSKVDAIPIDVTVSKYEDQLELSLGNVNTMKIREEKTTSISVPVNVVVNGDASEGYAICKSTGTPNLVRVTGPENLLKNAKEIRAEVNVDKITENVTTTVKPVLYNNDGEVIDSTQINMDTTSISVFIEVWKTKSVKIDLEVSGDPAVGYKLVSFDYGPKKVTIAASSKVLKSLKSIDLGKIYIDGRTTTYEKDLDLNEYIDQEEIKLVDENADVKAKASIEKVETRTIAFNQKDITVKGNGNKKVTFDSSNKYTMAIEGPTSLINNVKALDFAPWINVEGLEEGEHEVTVHVREVEGITVEETAAVKITLGD
jgi:YbbR domain-containing protein